MISSLINPSMEEDSLSDVDIDNILRRRMHYSVSPVVKVKTNDQGYRKSIGEPLVMHLPSEAVIPVFVPGDPEDHIGYFVSVVWCKEVARVGTKHWFICKRTKVSVQGG